MNAMKLAKVVLLTAFPLAAWASSADAATPPITYQGQLKFEGAPVNGMADFVFDLYDRETGGTILDTVGLVDVEVVNGLFTVELFFEDIRVFNGDARWLEVQVRTADGSAMLAPRQLIASAPYALYAYDAPSGGGECLWNSAGSDIYYTAGDVGVGTSSPATRLDVNGATRMTGFQLTTAPAAGRVLTSNASGVGTWQEPPGEDSPWNTSGIDIYYNAGDVGIGTSTPSYDLHVVTTGSRAIHGQSSSTAGRGVTGEATASTGTTYGVYGSSASSSGRAVYGTNTSSGYGVYGKSTSGVGVRAQSGGSGTTHAALYAYNSNSGGIGVFSTSTSTDANAVFVNKGTGDLVKGFSGTTGGDHVFGVDNDGHVGVGKGPSGNVPLDVLGEDNWDVANGEGDLRVGNSTYRLKMGVALGGVGAGSARIFAQGGNHKLTLGSNDQDVVTIVDANGATAGGGRVGIGTANPGELLHVVGDVEVDGLGDFEYATTGNTGVVKAKTTSSGRGLYAYSDSGDGAYGFSNSGHGVYGYSNNGSGVRAKCSGAGTANPALLVENINSDGIGIFSTSSSTDANAVFVNKGDGDLIRGFTGSTGGDLVFRVENNGKTSVGILRITGGSDLAEKFDVNEKVEPGMVVAIDPENPGKLCLARGAYNRRVAGVVSGANELSVGMILADLPGSQNSQPVALSGRVWVHGDATGQAIEPGDLLTTADRAGYAMAVADHGRAHGAVIGKAMTSLSKGETGMVLVLVNLQ